MRGTAGRPYGRPNHAKRSTVLHSCLPITVRRLAAATALAVLVLAATAFATTTSVVPPKGHAGGRSYAQWLSKFWRTSFATPPGGSICHRVGKVVVLTATPFAKGPNRCTVHAGRTLYVNGPSAECSNIEPAPAHGDTPAERRSCAKTAFRAVTRSKPKLTIDGRRLAHVGRFYVHTKDFAFSLPRKNILGSKKRHGRSVAYGAGFLIRHLKTGRHVITGKGKVGKQPIVLTYRIHVTG